MNRKPILLVLTVVIVISAFIGTVASGKRPQLGLDLRGGISVVLFPVKGTDPSLLDTARQIIENRVNALGVAEPEVTRQGNDIEVDLAGVHNRQAALDTIGSTGEMQNREELGALPVGQAIPDSTTTTTKPATTTTTKPGATTTTKPGATTTAPAVDVDHRGAGRDNTTTPKSASTVAGATTTTTKPADHDDGAEHRALGQDVQRPRQRAAPAGVERHGLVLGPGVERRFAQAVLPPRARTCCPALRSRRHPRSTTRARTAGA